MHVYFSCVSTVSVSVQSSARQLAECVDLLLQLNEPAEQLCDEFLAQSVSASHNIC